MDKKFCGTFADCVPCPTGTLEFARTCRHCTCDCYSSSPGSAMCTQCPDGYGVYTGRTSGCYPCPVWIYRRFGKCSYYDTYNNGNKNNTYSSSYGATSCKSCPTGQIPNDDGTACV